MNRDLKSNVDVATGFGPATRNASGTGTAVDLKGYDSSFVIVSLGTVATGGTFTPSLLESADGTTYGAVAQASLQGTFAAVAAASASLQRIGYIGTGRYVQPVLTFGGTGAGAPSEVLIARGHPARSPLA